MAEEQQVGNASALMALLAELQREKEALREDNEELRRQLGGGGGPGALIPRRLTRMGNTRASSTRTVILWISRPSKTKLPEDRTQSHKCLEMRQSHRQQPTEAS